MVKLIIIAILLYLSFSVNTWLGIGVTLFGILYVLYSNLPALYAMKGNAAISEKKLETALEWYKKAYKTDRASSANILTYATLLLRTGEVDEAETILNLVVLGKGKKADRDIKYKAKLYRSLLYYKTNREEDAIEDAEEVFDNFKNTMSYGLLGYLKLATNAPFDETYSLCTEAYEYNGDDRDIVDNMVVAHIRAGELDKAREVCDKLLENNPQFVEAHYHGAIIAKELGDLQKASELLENISQCSRTFLTTVSEQEIEELKEKIKLS